MIQEIVSSFCLISAPLTQNNLSTSISFYLTTVGTFDTFCISLELQVDTTLQACSASYDKYKSFKYSECSKSIVVYNASNALALRVCLSAISICNELMAPICVYRCVL